MRKLSSGFKGVKYMSSRDKPRQSFSELIDDIIEENRELLEKIGRL